MKDKGYYAFLLLNNYLGGPFMNTLLSLNIREKYGLAYNINSFYSPFTDCGIWGVYAGCEKNSLNKVKQLIIKELSNLCNTKISPQLLAKMKKQFLGSLTIAWESAYSQMLANGKDLLDFNHPTTYSQAVERIQSIQSIDIEKVANETMHPDKLSMLIYEPAE